MDKMHGGAPRVRRRVNEGEMPTEKAIVVDTGNIANKFVDAAISAGVSYVIANAISNR